MFILLMLSWAGRRVYLEDGQMLYPVSADHEELLQECLVGDASFRDWNGGRAIVTSYENVALVAWINSGEEYVCGDDLPSRTTSVDLEGVVSSVEAAEAVKSCLTPAGSARVEGSVVEIHDRFFEAGMAEFALLIYKSKARVLPCSEVSSVLEDRL